MYYLLSIIIKYIDDVNILYILSISSKITNVLTLRKRYIISQIKLLHMQSKINSVRSLINYRLYNLIGNNLSMIENTRIMYEIIDILDDKNI